jgi:soluble lytic murein transglycosylase
MRAVRVLIALFLLAAMVPLPLPGGAARAETLSASDRQLYRLAFANIAKDRWKGADRLAESARNPLPAKIIQWLDLTRPGPGRDFDDYRSFISLNPGWPSQEILRAQAERAMPDTLPPAEVLSWFGKREPTTLEGAMQVARALIARGDPERATTVLRHGWVALDGPAPVEKAFLARYKRYLTAPDHAERLDRLLWDEQRDAAQRLLALVDAGQRALATARLKLMAGKGGVDAALAKVPRNLLNDAGLLYERARWHRRRDNFEQAAALLDPPPKKVRRPDLLWIELESAARHALNRNDANLAYRLARDHGNDSGTAFAEAEWLAGWIAFRFLGRPDIAEQHFKTLYEGVDSQLSQARGAYWVGRTTQARGDKVAMRRWYELAAVNLTTYYGQLATHRLNRAGKAHFFPSPLPTKTETAAFEKQELVQVVRVLAALGEAARAQPFLLRLQEFARTAPESRLIADLGLAIGREDFSLATAKRARAQGFELVEHLFPLMALPKGALDDALIMSILRQESAFAVGAVSSAGALGLMQILPATAKHVAKKLKIKYSKSRLTSDGPYNITLGRAYLDELVRSFGGSYVLAIAAYNAGPSRVNGWIREFGDPRAHGADVVDWVERIPLSETRNYVQRVLENLQVYRHRIAKTRVAISLEQDLGRGAR